MMLSSYYHPMISYVLMRQCYPSTQSGCIRPCKTRGWDLGAVGAVGIVMALLWDHADDCGWKTDWITIGDLETTIWKLRFGNYGWETNNLCFSNCVSPIWKLWFRNYKSPIWKPNLRDLITKNLRFGNYVLGTEIPRFGNYHSPIW